MNESTPPKEERSAALSGLGTSRKRVEDARFTQGKGNYVDDIKLPGMLFGDFVRSPYAHARVKAINTEKAMAVPGVHAVLTAADLAPLSLHWMPTWLVTSKWYSPMERCCFRHRKLHLSLPMTAMLPLMVSLLSRSSMKNCR
jgi:CO/xanthine dehydrogenase Mo-binding subunit